MKMVRFRPPIILIIQLHLSSARLGKIKVGGLCKLLKKERPYNFSNITESWGLRPLTPIPPL